MARADFYHLLRSRLEDALPRLLERALAAERRVLVVAGSAERVEDLTLHLWSDRNRWLPHGSARDGHAADQPVWLTDDPSDNANGATFLFLCDGMDSPLAGAMERTFDLFNGHDPAAVEAARRRWTARLGDGLDLHYWQQGDDGRWVEKARRVAAS
jgi:DNA polymerase-3 subunit chi